MVCENCSKEHSGSYGSGRFCSKSCECSFNAKKLKYKKQNYVWICNFCKLKFDSRKKLYNHKHEMNHLNYNSYSENPYCKFCGEFHLVKYGLTHHEKVCLKNPNRDVKHSEDISNLRKELYKNNPELRMNASKRTINNSFWKYRSKNPIFYICKNGNTLKLDSEWELKVAKRLDDLNLNWYRPRIRIPYIDNNGIEKGYFPDFYVEDYKCFIEVKSPYISKRQNKNGKIDYLKSHYNFIFWIESELECSTFELTNLYYNESVEKEVSDIIENYKIRNEENKFKKSKKNLKINKSHKSINEQLKTERWNIIQNSNIDFTKFGWVKEISELFGIATNRGRKYIMKHYPKFYESCYKRKSPTNQKDEVCDSSN